MKQVKWHQYHAERCFDRERGPLTYVARITSELDVAIRASLTVYEDEGQWRGFVLYFLGNERVRPFVIPVQPSAGEAKKHALGVAWLAMSEDGTWPFDECEPGVQ